MRDIEMTGNKNRWKISSEKIKVLFLPEKESVRAAYNM